MARRIVPLFLMLMLFSGCSGLPSRATLPAPTTDPRTEIARSVAATVESQNELRQSVAATIAAVPSVTPWPTSTRRPTFTPAPPPLTILSPTETPLATDTPLPTATAISAIPQAIASKTVNLRFGPGTDYPVVGAAKSGSQYNITGRNQDGSWLEVCCINDKAVWVAKSVVEVGGDLGVIAVAKNIPPTPIPLPTSTEAPAATAKQKDFGSGFPQIGEEVEAAGWRFKVLGVEKRKAVYFYDRSYIAQGHFLILAIQATNLKPGTSYFAHDIASYITDVPANTYGESSKGSSYAQWMLNGADSLYTDVNPGVKVRMVVAYDLPDNLGDVLLSCGDALKWIYLRNFAAMPSKDK